MLPNQLKIYNFRSIGPEGVDLGKLKKANIIIGRNNSGKSNVIRGWSTAIDVLKRLAGHRYEIDPLDRYRRDSKHPFRIVVDFSPPEIDTYKYFKQYFDTMTFDITVHENGDIKWEQTTLDPKRDKDFIESWWKVNHGFTSGMLYPDQMIRDMMERAREYLLIRSQDLSRIIVIPEFRQIRDTAGEYKINGENLVLTLARLKNPVIGKDDDILKFRKIESFFKRLLSLSDDAHIEVSTENPTIIVENKGIRLPIDYYGTGVHQLIILLTAVLSSEGNLYGIEEPEIHLHSNLQKSFIDFLIKETNNNYIITTHSPSIINMPFTGNSPLQELISLTSLINEGDGSKGRPIVGSQAVLDAINDIGVSASDLLQSTGIIWVEGPSDRVYLNKWISLRDAEIIEGIHYHFMYYGGRLLSHYQISADDGELEGLINLLRINRNSIIIIDSDKDKFDSVILNFKTRILEQAEISGITCWITAGREIENYVHNDAINKTFQGSKVLDYQLGQFEKIDEKLAEATSNAGLRERHYESDKVKYSRRIVDHITLDHAPYDLSSRMQSLIASIRRWNSLPTK
ncbi:AAA family ATPase [Deinococcus sp. HMF7620]|uniref:AAA family ATPase n=1 Tax=Deinococcus arboris TaxID=2682977 RepID=A0A7C9HTP9_9DEIO|nr:ATP-binding protein [Deinococcus arboris]MVN88749.1 AAA family ATPase [Deinococcus arboris]